MITSCIYINCSYTTYFNISRKRNGHLFQVKVQRLYIGIEPLCTSERGLSGNWQLYLDEKIRNKNYYNSKILCIVNI